MSLVVYPLSFVDVAVGMNQLSLAISLVVLPLPFVFRAIWPHLRSKAIPDAVEPLAGVDGTILECNWPPGNPSIIVHLLPLLSKLGHSSIARSELQLLVLASASIPVLKVIAVIFVPNAVFQLALIQSVDLSAFVSARVAIACAISHIN